MPPIHCAGVYTDFILGEKRLVKYRMAKDNRLVKVSSALQKIISCPQAPLRGLLTEMAARLESGMDVNGVLILPKEREASKKSEMVGGHRSSSFLLTRIRMETVAGKRLATADLQKHRTLSTGQIFEKKELMITHEGNDPRVSFLQGKNSGDNFFGMWSPVDVITEKHYCIRSMRSFLQQHGKRSVATVNIANHTGG